MDLTGTPVPSGMGGYAPLPFPVRGRAPDGCRIPRSRVPSLHLVAGDDAPPKPENKGNSSKVALPEVRVVSGVAALVTERRRDAGPPDAVRSVVRENRLASRLPDDDARTILALRVADCLEGGEAAILRPDQRRRSLRLGRILGLAPFDANLVIAIAQDAARRGERAPHAVARDPRLAMIAWDPATRRISATRRAFALGACVLGAAGALFGSLVVWTLR